MNAPQLRIRRKRTVRMRRFCADTRSDTRLRTLRERYSTLTGRAVSTSVTVRRALEVLERHLDALATQAALDHEVAALVRAAA